jgi:hypothetical protein
MIESTITRAVNAAMAGATFGYNTGARATRAARRAFGRRGRTRSAATTLVVREKAPAALTMVAGEISNTFSIFLNSVEFADLQAAYDCYKIEWAEAVFQLQDDPGDGVVAGKNAWIVCGNDTTGQTTTPTFTQVSAFENHKTGTLSSGKTFTYRFAPKALNALATGNFAVNQSDWLVLSTAGAAVSHNSLLVNIKTTDTASVQKVDYIIRLGIRVKQMS